MVSEDIHGGIFAGNDQILIYSALLKIRLYCVCLPKEATGGLHF